MTYQPAELQFRVNGDRAANQYVSASAALEDGGFVIVWISMVGSAASVKAQRYDSAGLPVGSEFLVTPAGATGKLNSATVSALDGGGFVIAWETSDTTQDGSGSAIKAQVYDSAGLPSGAQFLVNNEAAGNQSGAAITTLADGSFLVSWTTSQPAPGGTLDEVKARHFDASGTALGAEFLVNTTTTGSQSGSSLAATPSGGFVATWVSGTGAAAEIYGQVFDADGVKLGSEFMVNTTTAGTQGSPNVTALDDGRFVVVWRVYPATGFIQTINGQIFDASGAKIGGEFLISNPAGNPQLGSPQVKALPDGGFVATWSAPGGTDVSTDVWAQLYDSTGTPSGARFTVTSATHLFEGDSRTLVTADGDIVVAWTSSLDLNNYDVNARIIALNAAPVIESDGGGATAAFTVAEDQNVVTRVLASDRVGGPVTYAIAGGADASLFAIDPVTGHLTFIAAPDAEAPADADQDNVYEVIVSASDGELADSQALSVTVGATGRGLLIVSSGQVSVGENATAAATVKATDAAATYAITGGADAAFFAIDAATGALSFVGAPNFEAPADSGGNNVYEVEVSASAAGQTAVQALAVTVRNVNEGPSFTTASSLSILENSTAVATIAAADVEGDPVTYTIVGGADSSKLIINASTGILSFLSAPNYEAPTDAGANNVYDVIVRATDGDIAVTQAFAITVGNVGEGATITSNGGGATAAISLPENQGLATTVSARDNPTGTTITYSIFGGVDASKFTINAQTGALNFVTVPNFESPKDSGLNNVYDVVVKASDGVFSDTQALAITITNVNEPFSITSAGGGDSGAISLAENSGGFTVTTDEQDAGTLTFSIIGGADAARFTVGAVIGKSASINFTSLPNYEAPADSNADNVYHVVIRVSDGTYSDTQTLAITITNVNEAVVITSNGAGSSASISMAENLTAVTNVAATDPENAAIVYSISGGADASKFSIDAATGALRFVTAPNFEVRTDVGANNVYDVIVRASDGVTSDTQAIAVIVTNVNEAPTITSGGGGDSASVTMNENLTAVMTITSTDPENSTRTYAIVGGADAARFAINATTGALSFTGGAPNYEAPADAGGDNVYDVIVRASDGSLFDTQTIAVHVANVNEALAITSNGGGSAASVSVAENGASVLTIAAVDPEGAAPAFAIAGGADASLFVIDGATGALSFIAAPDFEAPADFGADNIYEVIVSATDGSFTDTQALSIAVTDVDESQGGGGGGNFAFADPGAFGPGGEAFYGEGGGSGLLLEAPIIAQPDMLPTFYLA